MKRTGVMQAIGATVVSIIVCGFAHAEDAPVNFGVLGGVSLAYMEGSEIDALEIEHGSSADITFTGSGGLRIGYMLRNWFEIETGAYLTGNGYEILLASESGTDWSDGMPRGVTASLYRVRKVTLLEFPLSVRLQTPYFSSQDVKIYGFGGIRAGIVTAASERIVGETATSNFPNQGESRSRDVLEKVDLMENRIIEDSLGNVVHYSFNDFYRRGNLSLTVGFGMENRIGIVGLFIQGQYTYGLLNFNKLSDKARQELAAFESGSEQSSIVFLGEPEAYFRNVQVSAGLNVYIRRPE
jgi:hypothetical protein